MPENDRQVAPDVFTDVFNLSVTPWAVNLTLQKTPPIPAPGANPPETTCVVRMSLETAKVLAMLMRRQLRNFEADQGIQIAVSRQVLNSVSLSEEDWG